MARFFLTFVASTLAAEVISDGKHHLHRGHVQLRNGHHQQPAVKLSTSVVGQDAAPTAAAPPVAQAAGAPLAAQTLESKFVPPYVPTPAEIEAGKRTAALQAKLASLRADEAALVGRFYSMAEDNYTKMINAALPAVAAETSNSTAEMLGKMRSDMYKFESPFYSRVLLKRIKDNRAQQVVTQNQLAAVNATPAGIALNATMPTVVEKKIADAASGSLSWTTLTLFCVLAVLAAIGSYVLFYAYRRGRAVQQAEGHTLTIALIKGVGLANMDGTLAGKSDGFCTCNVLGRPQNQKLRTKTIDNNSDPEWNFEGQLHNVTAHDTLEFEVWDANTFKSDKFIGKVLVAACDFLSQGGAEGELELTGDKQKKTGSVEVRIQVEGASPSFWSSIFGDKGF